MGQRIRVFVPLLFALYAVAWAQDQTDATAVSEAAEGLDLVAVGELFGESEDLESFERALNDPEKGVNNLDLDGDGRVDYIRVVEEVSDETRVIVLQVPLGEDEFQDVATVEVERTDGAEYNLQVHGNEDLYGAHHYAAPAVPRIDAWPIVSRLYGPGYRPYRSGVVWGAFPRWWKPWRPVTVIVYRTRIGPYRNRRTFTVTHTSRVRTVHRVTYTPRRSARVKKRVLVRPAPKRNASPRPRRR